MTYVYSPRNFDIAYVDSPFDQAIQEWIAQGGEPWQLFETVDGFHINQYAHAIMSDVLWSWLQTNKSQWLPPSNPRNADIGRVFKESIHEAIEHRARYRSTRQNLVFRFDILILFSII